jgi:hypothetical protein
MRFYPLLCGSVEGMVQGMTTRRVSKLAALFAFALFACRCAGGQPTPAAISGFNSYLQTVEARLDRQHRSADGFLGGGVETAPNETRLRKGESIVERLDPAGGQSLPGALLHHWRGTAFVPGATVADFERLLRDFGGYPRYFSPQVLQAKVIAQQGDALQASMRVRQKHVLTVVMDTAYDVRFGRLDAGHGYSVSRSTRIAEIAGAGTDSEHVLSSAEEHGFLWRLNTYWSYEERDGGLYMQIETVSLTRSIPRGLGWAVGPFVESIPRESLEFTLGATREALNKDGAKVVAKY